MKDTQSPATNEAAHTPDLAADLRDLRQAINYLARQKPRIATVYSMAGAAALSRIDAALKEVKLSRLP